MSRIFVSYARDDADAATRLANAIAKAGHEVWWDQHLHGGSRFSAEIELALKEAEAVVVLWSETSIKSAWVQDEAAEGRDSHRLVPVTLGPVKPPLGFRQFQTIDVGPWCRAGDAGCLQDLLDAISHTCKPDTGDSKPAATQARPKASVCVLPFTNMSGEAEQEYFSDGISEDITTDLSKISALEVVARNTAFSFKGQSPDVKDVAKQLCVSHVLEGSVRKAGSRVRINAQLIDGETGKHLWADRFDRDLTDIFEIQDEISRAIVDALKVTLLPKEKTAIESRGTSSVEAYNLYLMARQQWITGAFCDERRDEAIERLCRQATALDPEYAQAWALMGIAQLELRFQHGKEVSALPAAERALEINPKLPEAHCIKARYLEEEGRPEEAKKQLQTAFEIDPTSWEVNREAARMLFRHGHIRESVPHFEKAARLMDMDFNSSAMLVTCYNSLGEPKQARQAAKMTLERAEKTIAKDPTNCSALAMGASALTAFGEKERAREWVSRALLLDPENLMVRYNLACSLALELDDPEGALEALLPFFENVTSKTMMRHLEVDPDLDPVRDDPRFKEMLLGAKKRLGITEIAIA